jgi:hypothetical protein
MKKIILASFILLSLFFSSFASADCRAMYEEAIASKDQKFLLHKHTEKKVLQITYLSSGLSTGIFGGLLFAALTDGSAVAGAILEGAMIGAVMGGATVVVVAVPFIVYDQIIKAEIQGLKKAQSLLAQAQALNTDDKELKKMYRKVHKKRTNLSMDDFIQAINVANAQNAFCEEGKRPDYLHQIKTYLLKAP